MPRAKSRYVRRAILSSCMEALFLGLGWFFSGRPFIGILMFSLGTGYLTVVYVVLAVAGNSGPFPVLLAIYAAMIILSGTGCYRSYVRDMRLSTEASV